LRLIGYSTATGEVFPSDIDLARAEIGPLAALGRIDSILEAGSGPSGLAPVLRRDPVRALEPRQGRGRRGAKPGCERGARHLRDHTGHLNAR
jgi:hypothetical protein